MNTETMRRLRELLQRFNHSQFIACHLLGAEHSRIHHAIIGIFIMLVGGTIMLLAHDMPAIIAMVMDTIGILLHAIGAIPFIEAVLEHKQKSNEDRTSTLEENPQQPWDRDTAGYTTPGQYHQEGLPLEMVHDNSQERPRTHGGPGEDTGGSTTCNPKVKEDTKKEQWVTP